MPPAAVMAGSAVLGAAGSIAAGNAAAGATQSAANTSSQTQLQMFNTANAMNAPWRQAGGQAINALGSYFIPGYQASNPFAAPQAALPQAQGGGGSHGGGLMSMLNPLRVGSEPGTLFGGLNGIAGGLFGSSGRHTARTQPAPASAPQAPYQAPVQSQQGLIDFFQNSPGYQFRLGEGQNQLDRMAAAGGNYFSGRALQGAQEYGQNFASNEFGNYINQLANIAGLGSGSANQSGQFAMNTGQQIGQNQLAAGNARAGAYMNQGNALNGLLNQGAGLYGYSQGWGRG